MSQPLSTRACGLRSEAGLLGHWSTPSRPPAPPEAYWWLCALQARRGRPPRSQWRVRAGFSPASLHHRPYEHRDPTRHAGGRRVELAGPVSTRTGERWMSPSGRVVAPDSAQVDLDVAKRSSFVAQRNAVDDQPAGMVDIVGSAERERALWDPILQVPVRERPLLDRPAHDLLVPLIPPDDVMLFPPLVTLGGKE